ncbi:uncharacterized protein A1O9_08797 [Exophiala aquamarina CBS 119918]|uniref:C2H2-type domain-containing protein n=1 Tax=Exophiala aquamarina CBS 119918 TaxID=1182545 RepID=A0A072P4V0_9EURO|nr:uncharacterized protein A1O9_08797 [Exophiala aquamarina CBS 119918]KEF55144.1 hypothetical protein A1O9_08797 [Exophiala aquamarina CBS 119918]
MNTPRVPCYWPGCQKSMVLNYLGRHLEREHNIIGGFGCHHCGFKATSEEVVRVHIIQHHGLQEEPRRAERALALYYRERFRQDDPSVRDLPLSAFWNRGRESFSKTDGRCRSCNDIIEPYTKAYLMRHMGTKHTIIVDLDFTRVCSSRAVDELPTDIDNLVWNDNESELSDYNEQEDFGRFFDEDDEDGKEKGTWKDSQESIENGQHEGPVSCGDHKGTPKATLSSTPMRDHDAERLQSTFISCIRDESVKYFEESFKVYETRAFADKTYRVNKNLPPRTKLDCKDIVSAVLIDGNWNCEVPQCGAVLDETFEIDVHLQAHSAIFWTKWYCGDISCYTGTERIFDDCGSFDSHVVSEHMSSNYSVAAGRRVPKREVLVTSLLKHLKLIRIFSDRSKDEDKTMTVPITFVVDQEQENTNSEPKNYGPSQAVEQEYRAWSKFALQFGMDEDPGSDDEIPFLEPHYDRPIYFLPEASRDAHRSIYLVQTLTFCTKMYEEDAWNFIKLYHKLCSQCETNNVSVLRKALGLPQYDVLLDPGQPKSKDRILWWPGQDGTQDGNCSLVHVWRCPWPTCGHTTAWEYYLVVHFLSTHLNCRWKCPERGCEHCCYRNPHQLEQHRMNCHVGSPLQCGHQDCSGVFVRDSWRSRGYMNYDSLRAHLEIYFNRNLENSRNPASDSGLGLNTSGQEHKPQKALPTKAVYMGSYARGSASYLNKSRRMYRREQNFTILTRYKVRHDNIEVRGSKVCTGFSFGHRHFACIDSVSLSLDTAMLIYVPSRLLFTVAPTCDYCIHLMSLISRDLANPPQPFVSHPKTANMRTSE